MPSSTSQRASANMARRTHPSSGADGQQSGPSPSRGRVSILLPTHDNAAYADRDYDENARDTFINTELNKAHSERDRCKALWEQANKKLLESQQQKDALKAQVKGVEEENDSLHREVTSLREELGSLRAILKDFKAANAELAEQNKAVLQRCAGLEQQYHPMAGSDGGSAASSTQSAPSPASAGADVTYVLPRRTKSSHKRTTSYIKEQRGDRSLKKDHEREYDADKERLKGRFGDRSASPTSPASPIAPIAPTTPARGQDRRHNHIESWGPRQDLAEMFVPPTSANQGLMPVALSPAYDNVAFSSVPRTSVPMSSIIYDASAAGALSMTTDDGSQPRRYRPHPMNR